MSNYTFNFNGKQWMLIRLKDRKVQVHSANGRECFLTNGEVIKYNNDYIVEDLTDDLVTKLFGIEETDYYYPLEILAEILACDGEWLEEYHLLLEIKN